MVRAYRGAAEPTPLYFARNSICACEPSQKGLFCDWPHRQSVARFRFSYSKPRAETTMIPPRNPSGPLHCCAGSSTRPIDTGSLGSIAEIRALIPRHQTPGRTIPYLSYEVFRGNDSANVQRSPGSGCDPLHYADNSARKEGALSAVRTGPGPMRHYSLGPFLSSGEF